MDSTYSSFDCLLNPPRIAVKLAVAEYSWKSVTYRGLAATPAALGPPPDAVSWAVSQARSSVWSEWTSGQLPSRWAQHPPPPTAGACTPHSHLHRWSTAVVGSRRCWCGVEAGPDAAVRPEAPNWERKKERKKETSDRKPNQHHDTVHVCLYLPARTTHIYSGHGMLYPPQYT